MMTAVRRSGLKSTSTWTAGAAPPSGLCPPDPAAFARSSARLRSAACAAKSSVPSMSTSAAPPAAGRDDGDDRLAAAQLLPGGGASPSCRRGDDVERAGQLPRRRGWRRGPTTTVGTSLMSKLAA